MQLRLHTLQLRLHEGGGLPRLHDGSAVGWEFLRSAASSAVVAVASVARQAVQRGSALSAAGAHAEDVQA